MAESRPNLSLNLRAVFTGLVALLLIAGLTDYPV
jgi:hypothetical protein